MQRIAAFVLSLCLVASALSQEGARRVTIPLLYCKVRQKDGTVVNLQGVKLTGTMVPIRGTSIQPSRGNFTGPDLSSLLGQSPRQGRAPLQSMYWADQDPNNTGSPIYGVIDPEIGPSCSILDDIQINSGHVGKILNQLMFGMSNEFFHNVLVRYTVMTGYNQGAPAGTSAFTPWPVPPDYLLDFGFIWNGSLQGGNPLFKVLLGGFAPYQISFPQDQVWLSQQFLVPNNPPDPFTADFDETTMAVFNQSAPPQVGFSDLFFWYDFNPPDKMYEEQEKDTFNNEGLGNLLLRLVVDSSGSIVDLNPSTVIVDKGFYDSGDLTDLWFSDDFYYKARPDYTLNRGVPPIQIIVEGVTPNANITSLSFNVESACDGGGGVQKLQLYKYSSPAGWVDVNTRSLDGNDYNYTYFWNQGSPSQFVNPTTRRMRAKVLVTPDPTASRGFKLRLDRTRWTVGLP